MFSHFSSLNHVTPPGHPERVERYEAILKALADARFDSLDLREAPIADPGDILRCHPQAYVDSIEVAIPDHGFVSLDPDTHVSPGSLEAARRGVGGCCAAVDAVLAGET